MAEKEKGKFDDVEVDENTVFLIRLESKLGELDVLYEKWSWDGIDGESLVFANSDIENLSDEELKNEIKSSPLVNDQSGITLKKTNSGYTFVNFNFAADGDVCGPDEGDDDSYSNFLVSLDKSLKESTLARRLPTSRDDTKKYNFIGTEPYSGHWRLRFTENKKRSFMLFKKVYEEIWVEKDYENYIGNPYSLDEGLQLYHKTKSEGWEALDESEDFLSKWMAEE